MCGIGGFIGVSRETASRCATRMARALGHRGPDDSGIVALDRDHSNPVILVHTRLSILDLSPTGHQPMRDNLDEASPNWIAFNGEIYNFPDLRNDVAKAGYRCRGRSDTETILYAYRMWGTEAVHRLRGMFAFCLVDTGQCQVWLCRDRIGIKPIYVVRPPGGGLVFASELRAILACGPEVAKPRLADAALESFLAQGCVFGSPCIVEGVELLPPATSLVVDFSGAEKARTTYWSLPRPDATLDSGAAVMQGRTTLAEAVDLHLVADVPLGLFLSGGIDSGVLATLASERHAHVQTISVGFDDERFDETGVAQAVARELGTNHTVCRLSGQEMADEIGPIIDSMDQPTVDGFNTYMVCRAAKRAGLTVALSGLGGDELFAGYSTFRDAPRSARVQKFSGILKALQVHRLARGRAGVKLAELLQRPNHVVQRLLLRRELFLREERRGLRALTPGVDRWTGIAGAELDRLMRITESRDTTSQISALEIQGYMSHMLLRDADVFSMANQMELRVPLLDHVFVEQVMRLPSALKIGGRQPKALLIRMAGERFPKLLRGLPKRGFAFPWKTWLTGPLRSMAGNAVRDNDVWATLGFDPGSLERMWGRFIAGDTSVSPLMIVALVVLQRYVRRHSMEKAA